MIKRREIIQILNPNSKKTIDQINEEAELKDKNIDNMYSEFNQIKSNLERRLNEVNLSNKNNEQL